MRKSRVPVISGGAGGGRADRRRKVWAADVGLGKTLTNNVVSIMAPKKVGHQARFGREGACINERQEAGRVSNGGKGWGLLNSHGHAPTALIVIS